MFSSKTLLFFSFLTLLGACQNSSPTTTQDPNVAKAQLVAQKDTVTTPPPPPATNTSNYLAAPIYNENDKVVYLTFDDGPLEGSANFNQVIADKGVRASVFLVGRHAMASKKLTAVFESYRANPLIQVCNHSWSHANNQYQYFYSNPQKSMDDITGSEAKLGLTYKIVRLPGRDCWKTPNRSRNMAQSGGKTAQLLADAGYKLYGWDGEWNHYGNGKPKESAAQIVNMIDGMVGRRTTFTKNHFVLLAHDQMLQYPSAVKDLETMIDMLRERGYVFEYIGNYPEIVPAEPITTAPTDSNTAAKPKIKKKKVATKKVPMTITDTTSTK